MPSDLALSFWCSGTELDLWDSSPKGPSRTHSCSRGTSNAFRLEFGLVDRAHCCIYARSHCTRSQYLYHLRQPCGGDMEMHHPNSASLSQLRSPQTEGRPRKRHLPP